MDETLLIRTDANTQMGTGHVMRCLALAQAWQETGGQACFVLAFRAPALESRLQTEGVQVVHLNVSEPGSAEDVAATAVLGRRYQAQWIVIDGYHFDAAYQRYLHAAGFRILFIDDYGHAAHYYADIVLNQNICAHPEIYLHREPYTRLLLGTKHALLRREFWPWRDWQRPFPEKARKILVTLGGSDPDNVTLAVIQALCQLPDNDLEAVVLVGAQNPHYRELAMAVSEDARIQLRQNVTNMPEVMAWADLAISAGGSTSWELSFMGLPALVMILADNQVQTARELAAIGAVHLLEPAALTNVAYQSQIIDSICQNYELRHTMSQKAHSLVDGRGGVRVMEAISQIIPGVIDE